MSRYKKQLLSETFCVQSASHCVKEHKVVLRWSELDTTNRPDLKKDGCAGGSTELELVGLKTACHVKKSISSCHRVGSEHVSNRVFFAF